MWKLCFNVFLLAVIECRGRNDYVHHFQHFDNDMAGRLNAETSMLSRVKRDIDSKCQAQEQQFLNEIYQDKKRIEEKRVFDKDNNTGMALAWAGTHGTMIFVTSQEAFGQATASSNVYRTKDYGLNFENINHKLSPDKPIYIRKHAGIFRHPDDPNRVYLVSVTSKGTTLYLTEDSGETFETSQLDFQIDSAIEFSPKNKNYLLASSSVLTVKTLYVSRDNGRNWNRIQDSVNVYKWGLNKNIDTDQTIYAAVDEANTHPFIAAFMEIKYNLRKTTDLGKSWTTLKKDVVAFGHQDKFIYIAIPESPGSENRKMMVSSNGGQTWDKTYLPTMNGERFFSVLDMNEGLVFMHVDNPGDTGHGTLYTSSGKGMVYSESLTQHLYPNYGDTTDFYRVLSMRGVYLASQMKDDKSIHTVISYNLGGTWHPVPKPINAPCKDENKECALQIHGSYSRNQGIISELPISVPGAPGVILVHGHVADALQITNPDVFITTDGGYEWRKALDGPHHYAIADSGSLLVAVPADTNTPKVIKFSTDEGRCWHTYNFIPESSNETVMYTGLVLEPGTKSLTVSVWGYKPDTKKWTAFIIDFHQVLKSQCNLNTDYENWVPHETNNEKGNIHGCLLGKRETFSKVKQDSWCYNGIEYSSPTDGKPCSCVRDDFECDYGYYRPQGSDFCVVQPNFKLPQVDICEQGHEESVITEGYRKLPNDECVGGFKPKGNLIDLHKKCSSQEEGKEAVQWINVPEKSSPVTSKFATTQPSLTALGENQSTNPSEKITTATDLIQSTEVPTEIVSTEEGSSSTISVKITPLIRELLAGHRKRKPAHNASAIVAVIVIVVLIFIVAAVFLGYKYIILRRHNVAYRYSLLHQNDPVNYEDELENQLTKAGLYHDDSDEELNSPAVKKENGAAGSSNGRVKSSRTSQLKNDVKSYHDVSDDDMLLS